MSSESGVPATRSTGGAGPVTRRVPGVEALLVLGVSLGASALYSLVSLIGSLTAAKPLAEQRATLNPSATPGRPWLDLSYQLLGVGTAVVPALLAVFLLGRDPGPVPAAVAVPGTGRPVAVLGTAPPGAARLLGLRPARPGWDLPVGLGLAALIGLPGLGLYLAAHALGINATVVPSALPKIWWAVPVLVLSAIENAILEEVVVVGYLLTRLRQLGWALPAVVAGSAILRGSYHLYQGFGGFLGNAVMGVVFALFFLRYQRVAPLVIAHATIDTVAFVGYALGAGHLAFLN